MPLFSRSRAETPLPSGVVVEPLDAEGLYAIAKGLSDERCEDAAYRGAGWTVFPEAVYDDVGGQRCVGIHRQLVHLIAAKTATVLNDATWGHMRDVTLPAVGALALAAGLATDPAYVDRIAGHV